MKKIRTFNKKIIALITAVVIALTACGAGLFAYADSRNIDPNVVLFDSILNHRNWVVDSLVNDDFSNNPYTQICNGASEESFLNDVLESYQNDEAFKILVDALQLKSNVETDVSKWSTEAVAVLMHEFGLVDDEGLLDIVDTYAKSAEQLKYEDIINAVLSEDYTSSWGSTLFQSDSDLEHYRQMAKTLKQLSKYQKALKDNNDLLAGGFFESEEDFRDYTDNFLSAYEDTLYDALTNVLPKGTLSDNEALSKKIIGLSALAFVLKAETYNPLKTNISEADYQGSLISEKYNEYFADDIASILKGAGKALKIGSAATEYATVLEALVSQNDTTVQVLNRISSNSSNNDLRNTLNTYSKMVKDQGNTMAFAVDSYVDYLTRQNVIGKSVIKAGKKTFGEFMNLYPHQYSKFEIILSNRMARGLVSAGQCVEIAVWVADKATNIQETAKKIYICKCIQEVIDEAVATYEADYNAYQSDKTDENAKKCLDDLEFIKKLRLYGEKQAYGSVTSQTESIVGLLLGGGSLSDNIEQHYQGNVDALLGCTLSASANTEFSVNKNETLTIMPWRLNNGSVTTYARLQKEDKSYIDFPEADTVLTSSLKLNGGTVNVYNSDSIGAVNIFVPVINNTAESEIYVRGSNFSIGELKNSNKLKLNLYDNASSFAITDSITNDGTLNINGNGQSIRCQDIANNKTVSITDSSLMVYGNLENNGSVNGTVNICGDATKVYNEGYYDIGTQTLSGTGSIENLLFTNRLKSGVSVTGSQTVTQRYDDNATRLKGATNIYLTGNCTVSNNKIKNDISFKDYSPPTALTIDGATKIYNAVTLNNDTVFNNALELTENSSVLNINAPAIVKGDLNYKGGSISGSEWMKLHGDVNITSASPQIDYLDFVGLLAQKVTSSNELTVKKLNNQNRSLKGVDIGCKINVTDELLSDSTAAYSNGENIVLTQNAKLSGGTVKGSLSAKDWNCNNTVEIKGTLKASGNITVANGAALKATTYSQSDGALTVNENAALTAEAFNNAGTTANSGRITVTGDATISGTLDGGTLESKGDLTANAKLMPSELIFSGKVAQKFSNSAETTVLQLTISNSSKSGFTVGNVITVTNSFDNDCIKLIHSENIVLTGNAVYINNNQVKGDLTISGNYTLPENEELNINGKLIVKDGSSLNVKDGAKLTVKQNIVSNSATISVDENAVLQVDNYFSSNSDTLNINGDFIVKGDALVTSSTVNASGLITLKGDLTVNGGTWNKPNLALSSKVPQTVYGSAISVNNLEITNLTKTGIKIQSDINYYGTLTKEVRKKSFSTESANHLIDKSQEA